MMIDGMNLEQFEKRRKKYEKKKWGRPDYELPLAVFQDHFDRSIRVDLGAFENHQLISTRSFYILTEAGPHTPIIKYMNAVLRNEAEAKRTPGDRLLGKNIKEPREGVYYGRIQF